MRAICNSPAHPFENTLLAILSGVTLTAAFPPGPLSLLAWVALVPLLFSIRNASAKSAFRLGCLAGLVHYLTLIYWIVVVLGHYGNLNIFLSLLALFLLSGYLSLYIGAFSLLTISVRQSRLKLLLLPTFWVALEYLRSYLLTGFPWCLLGYTQHKALPVIQIADVFGVYGVSFFIVLVNTFLFNALSQWKHSRLWPKWETILTLVIAGSLLTYGYVTLSRDTTGEVGSPRLRAAIVQANIDQSLKWDPSYQDKTLNTYEKLTRLASATFHPELIIWPETAVPFFFQDHHRFSRRVLALSRETGEALVFGAPAYERQKGMTRYYNRAYLLNPRGGPGADTAPVSVSRYDKVHLVPFGEYVPLKGLFPFLDKLVQAAGDFAPGKDPEPLSMNGRSLGVLICFEAIFPQLARDLVNKGAAVLINLTNDAWFGKSSAPYQHLSMAVFRCVETRRPMIRAANTGFSAFISPSGKIMSRSDLFSEAVLYGAVATNNKDLTFYTRYGDLFALVLTALSILKTAQAWVSRRKKRKQT